MARSPGSTWIGGHQTDSPTRRCFPCAALGQSQGPLLTLLVCSRSVISSTSTGHGSGWLLSVRYASGSTSVSRRRAFSDAYEGPSGSTCLRGSIGLGSIHAGISTTPVTVSPSIAACQRSGRPLGPEPSTTTAPHRPQSTRSSRSIDPAQPIGGSWSRVGVWSWSSATVRLLCHWRVFLLLASRADISVAEEEHFATALGVPHPTRVGLGLGRAVVPDELFAVDLFVCGLVIGQRLLRHARLFDGLHGFGRRAVLLVIFGGRGVLVFH